CHASLARYDREAAPGECWPHASRPAACVGRRGVQPCHRLHLASVRYCSRAQVTLKLAPLLEDSEFLQLELGLPLGMVIEVQDDGGGSIAGPSCSRRSRADAKKTRVVITDALPGYSSFNNVKKGDLLRAITAYRTVLVNEGGYSAWKQVFAAELCLTSYTPVGEPMLKRLVFRCEGASYNDIKDAIQSHREGNSIATLIVERSRSVDDSNDRAVESESGD
ncbi:MAG: hypothetical protein SGPRY_005266, partial [Prymnesium sp.]